MKKIFLNFLVLFFTLLIIDNLILMSSAYLPWKLVQVLSQKSQINYKIRNGDESYLNYEEYIYTYKPGRKIPLFVRDGELGSSITDENGYRNPLNYLKNKENLDYLLIGDSFTAYPNYSKYLREFLDGEKLVYSIGVGGQGFIHWQYQLDRFFSIYEKKLQPKNIILNFYENDFDDSLRAEKYFAKKLTHSVYYPLNIYGDNLEKVDRNFSFFHEYYSILRYIVVTSKIREKITLLFDRKKTNFNQKYSFTLSKSADCKIKFENPFSNNEKYNDYFTKEKKEFYKSSIVNVLKKIDYDITSVYFVYIPSASVIYSQKFQEPSLKETFKKYKKADSFFKNLFKELDFNVKYVNVTDDLIKIANTKYLHTCEGNDIHFSDTGFKIFAKLLIPKIS